MNVLRECLCCGGSMWRKLIDLGSQPLANSYHNTGMVMPAYPLAVNECGECGHRQLSVAVNPKEMFTNYPYVSGTSSTLREYFKWLASLTFRGGKIGRALDIGCNDGTLLREMAKYATAVHGVDLAENLVRECQQSGLDVTHGEWNESHPMCRAGMYETITAINVLPHASRPYDFMTACRIALAPYGRIYVQISQWDWFEKGQIDVIYHEHANYFTRESFGRLCKGVGLDIVSEQRDEIHGGSMLFTLADRRAEFVAGAQRMTSWLREMTMTAQYNGEVVVGYGAAAKANTVMNFAETGATYFDYVVDDNPSKYHLYTPGTDLPISPPSKIAEESCPMLIVLLAWNFAEEIVAKVRALRGDKPTRFLQYYPEQKVFE